MTTGHLTHDCPMTVEQANSFGLSISTDMLTAIYKLMDLYPQTGVGRPSVNFELMPEYRQDTDSFVLLSKP